MLHGAGALSVAGTGGEGVAAEQLQESLHIDAPAKREYPEIVWRALGQAARRSMEEHMREIPLDEYTNPWIRRGIEKGLAIGQKRGLADALLAVLEARGFGITTEQRVRIEACRDADLLRRCLPLAATATSVEEALSELSQVEG